MTHNEHVKTNRHTLDTNIQRQRQTGVVFSIHTRRRSGTDLPSVHSWLLTNESTTSLHQPRHCNVQSLGQIKRICTSTKFTVPCSLSRAHRLTEYSWANLTPHPGMATLPAVIWTRPNPKTNGLITSAIKLTITLTIEKHYNNLQ